MENLNAEKVKKALEIHTGILNMLCEECPYNCDAHDEICLDVLAADILALINSQEQRIGELEAECEQWRSDWEENQKQWEIAYDKLEAENLKLTEENETLTIQRNAWALAAKAIQADTVRKMQQRIKQYIDVGHYRSPTEICFSELDVANIIDQIAKEMLEGEK